MKELIKKWGLVWVVAFCLGVLADAPKDLFISIIGFIALGTEKVRSELKKG